ncbi:MAG TPA: TetR/AcrR family transcriptional regulator [Acidimicrobiales bacterium]|nr:TetR/AcrR family transcriptional regulator [Acidimicrobiales bacterium]
MSSPAESAPTSPARPGRPARRGPSAASRASGPGRRRLEPERRRAEIVQAASALYRGRDPATVRFEEVADAAGVSRSLVYAYFGDRGGLLAAVYLHSLAGLDEDLSSLLNDVPVDEARLGALVRRYLCLVRDNAASWPLFASAGALEHPAVQQARRSRIQCIADTWGGGPAERLLARGVIGMLEAGASEWVEHQACSLAEAADLLTRTLWNGLGRFPRVDTGG